MGDRDQDLCDTKLVGDDPGTAVNGDNRSSTGLRDDFNVAPADSFRPTSAERLHDGFLGRPTTGIVLEILFTIPAILRFTFGKHPVDEELAVLFEHAADPQRLDDIRSQSNDPHPSTL